jgi:hypothetical protein
VHVSASLDAVAHIRDRGGTAYVWFGDALETLTEPPTLPVDWARLPCDGIEVWFDRSLPEPEELRLELDRPPRRNLRARGTGGAWSNAMADTFWRGLAVEHHVPDGGTGTTG